MVLGEEPGAILGNWIACVIDSAIEQKPYGIFMNISNYLKDPSANNLADLALNLVLGGFLPELGGGLEHPHVDEEHDPAKDEEEKGPIKSQSTREKRLDDYRNIGEVLK